MVPQSRAVPTGKRSHGALLLDEMVRNYKRVSNKCRWSSDTLSDAIDEVKAGQPMRAVARAYKIPCSTLRHRYVKGKTEGKFGRRTIFTAVQERDLVRAVLEPEESSLTSLGLRRLAFQYAESHNIPNNFNRETQTAGKDWLYYFCKRHPEVVLMKRGKGSTRTTGTDETEENSSNSFQPDDYDYGYGDDSVEVKETKFVPIDIPFEPETTTSAEESTSSNRAMSLDVSLDCMSKVPRFDEFDLFGQLVASHLRTMPPDNSIRCQGKIFSIITGERMTSLRSNSDCEFNEKTSPTPTSRPPTPTTP